MKLSYFSVLLVAVAFFQVGHADTAGDLEEMLERQVSILDTAVAQATTPEDGRSEEDWYFQNFWLRVRLPLGFSVPFFATLQVVPEVELLFRRENQENWVPYHP